MSTIYLKKASDLVQYITLNSEKLVVVDFFTDWCGPCKFIGKMFEEELLPRYKNDLMLIKINVDNPEFETISSQFGIRGIPRLIFYHNKKIVDDVTGANKAVIEKVCETYCK